MDRTYFEKHWGRQFEWHRAQEKINILNGIGIWFAEKLNIWKDTGIDIFEGQRDRHNKGHRDRHYEGQREKYLKGHRHFKWDMQTVQRSIY